MKTSSKSNRVFAFNSFALLVLMIIISSVFNHIEPLIVIRFIFYQLCLIIVPGILLMMNISVKEFGFVENILFSYMLGYSFNILAYAVSMAFGSELSSFYLIGIYIVMTLSLATLLAKKKGKIELFWRARPGTNDERAIIYIMLCTVFAVKLLAFSLSENSLYEFGGETYQQDYLTWVSDVSACKASIPPLSSADGTSIRKYHYLVAAQIACISNLCGISAVNATNSLSFIQSTLLVSLSGCVLVFKFVNKVVSRIGVVLLLFFSTGFEAITNATYQWHLFVMPMGFDYGYAFFMGIVILMFFLVSKEKKDVKIICLEIVFTTVLVGVKGPSAAVALLLTAICCIYSICIQRDIQYRRMLFMAITSAILFCLLYRIMMWGAVDSFNPKILHGFHSSQDVFSVLSAIKSVGNSLIDIIIIFLFTTMCISPIAVFYIIERVKEGTRDYYSEMLMIVYTMASVITALISMYGASQVYFVETAVCIPIVIAGRAVEKYFDVSIKEKALIYYLTISICAIASLKMGYLEGLALMISNSVREIGGVSASFTGEHPVYVSRNEYDAYMWINNNIGVNKRISISQDFSTSQFVALSERFTSGIVDDEILQMYFDRERKALEIINSKADYLMISTRVNAFIKPTDKACIFNNSEILIFETN